MYYIVILRDSGSKNVAPVLPMNRYRFGLSANRIKAGSRLPNRIILHPERIEGL